MSDGNYQMDVSHTFATHFFLCNFHPATIADNPFVTDTLVFSAMAFVILDRTENTLAKKTVTLRFVRTIVNRFRFQNFTTGVFKNFFRGSQTDGYF